MRIYILFFLLLLLSSWNDSAESTPSLRTEIADYEGFVSYPNMDRVYRYVRKYVQYNTTTTSLLEQSFIYFPIVEKELRKRDMPNELKYLTLIESGMRPRAVSPVGAVGLWQMMPATARELGLKMNHWVDERRDPVLSTNSALTYLQYLYDQYEDWTLAMIAYNSGPGKVNRAIRSAGSTSLNHLMPFLPKETQHYIAKLLAFQYIYENDDEFAFTPVIPYLDHLMTRTVLVNNDIHLKEISRASGLSISFLRQMNPSLQTDLIKGSMRAYGLRVPERVAQRIEVVLHQKDSEPAAPVRMRYEWQNHTAAQATSLFQIADELGVDPYLLKTWNYLEKDHLEEGTYLIYFTLVNPLEQQRLREAAVVDPIVVKGFITNLDSSIQNQKRISTEKLAWYVQQAVLRPIARS